MRCGKVCIPETMLSMEMPSSSFHRPTLSGVPCTCYVVSKGPNLCGFVLVMSEMYTCLLENQREECAKDVVCRTQSMCSVCVLTNVSLGM